MPRRPVLAVSADGRGTIAAFYDKRGTIKSYGQRGLTKSDADQGASGFDTLARTSQRLDEGCNSGVAVQSEVRASVVR
jgi:hypothetical protein